MLDKLPTIETHEHDPIEAAERIIADMPNRPEIQYTGSKAFYSSITDRITLPPRELFTSAEEFYATALHETVHSSGSQKRLAREGICEAAPFGSPVYSKEELVAEFGAAYLCAEAGISTAVLENQAAYVAGWLKKFRDDRKLLIHAAAQAQRAADFILNRTYPAIARRPSFRSGAANSIPLFAGSQAQVPRVLGHSVLPFIFRSPDRQFLACALVCY